MVEHQDISVVSQPPVEATQAMKISFGVKRKEQPKLVTVAAEVTAVHNDSDEERELEEMEREAKRRRLDHFENGVAPKDADEVKSSVVIPLVVEHDWRVTKLLELQKLGPLSEEDKAKLAILTENQPFSSEKDSEEPSIVMDVDKPAAEDADYSSVAIEDFGLAILRGCGWRDGQGIGRNPQVVPLRMPNRRPNGLGLGATLPQAKDNNKGGKKQDEELSGDIVSGSLVKVESGKLQGNYGKVEARDDENNHVFVRLALGCETVKVSLFALSKVTRKEYERDSKCINKRDYDKEKDKIDKKREEIERSQRSKQSGYDDRKDDINYQSSKQGSSKESEPLWVQPDLVVRFIDKNYERGRLYGQKLRVVDVASRKDISLEDDNGKTYYNLRQTYIETVIPRSDGERLMVVRGRHSGSAAVMESKDKKKSRVVARLLRSNKVVDIHFDDVCLFRPTHEEDFD